MGYPQHSHSYWQFIWQRFRRNRLGSFALVVVGIFCLIGVYAPILASSKPLIVYFEGDWYFPLFRYLFYRGFFTKRLDLFYNLLMFTAPLLLLTWLITKHRPRQRMTMITLLLLGHGLLFIYLAYRQPEDPAASPLLNQERQRWIQSYLQNKQQNPLFYSPLLPNWDVELSYLTPYAKLNLILRYQQRRLQHDRLLAYQEVYAETAQKWGQFDKIIPTLWHYDQENEREDLKRQRQILEENEEIYPKAKAMLLWLESVYGLPSWYSHTSLSSWFSSHSLVNLSSKDHERLIKSKEITVAYEKAQAQIIYLQQRNQWLAKGASQLQYEVMPLLRSFHWEDDAGGNQTLNRFISWWDLTRINRKDMIAALIFGVRISLSVGLLAITLALLIGVPVGAISGFYGGKVDIVTYRLIEIWESMPTFFMLLMIVAFLQSKSIFLVIGAIGLFGWTGFSRFIRGEFFRQKQLPYVEACRALGFNHSYIMFSHLLPNAIPPLFTLIPFAIMGAITTEAGLSFLGLGEEGSCSWGVLMDEGRTAFPAESYLLWPPAILLTILLVAIALVGDSLRDALDPKMQP